MCESRREKGEGRCVRGCEIIRGEACVCELRENCCEEVIESVCEKTLGRECFMGEIREGEVWEGVGM